MIPTQAQIFVDEIKKTGAHLTTKEKSLVASVNRAIRRNRLISDAQAKWLKDIYERATEIGPIKR